MTGWLLDIKVLEGDFVCFYVHVCYTAIESILHFLAKFTTPVLLDCHT